MHVFTIVVTFLLLISVTADHCIPVDFGNGSPVCQCNATYCDYYADPESPDDGKFIWYVTSKAGQRLSRSDGKVSYYPINNYKITVDANSHRQTIIGFGAAFTDASGINIKKLSKGCQVHVMKSYFSENGNKYNLGRVPIAGTDFSTRPYTYDDTPGDTALHDFSLANEDYQYKIPFMKTALELSPSIRFVSASWTAPPWMKKHHQYNNFDYLREEYYQVYVNYIIKFFEEYKKHGFDMWALSTGNEPFTPLMPHSNINSMYWSPAEVATWVINNLGPSLQDSNFNKTSILVFDDQRISVMYYIATILDRFPRAMDFIMGIAVHWYSDGWASPDSLDLTHDLVPDKFMLMTESCLGAFPEDNPKVILGSWNRTEEFVKRLFENFNHWIVGWMDWNLALDKQGGPNWVKNYVDAFIIVDPEKDVFYKQPLFYAFAHFSKFVPRNSVKIDVTSPDDSIWSTGFKTTNEEIVVLLYNTQKEKVSVTVVDGSAGNINIALPPHSLHTILYKSK